VGWSTTSLGQVVVGLVAWIASLTVTAVYHLGYAEYRGRRVAGPVIGNGMMTLGLLITANPLAAILSHVAMHTAAVWHGPDTAFQLPPHYSSATR
jgi:hypothetical protein